MNYEVFHRRKVTRVAMPQACVFCGKVCKTGSGLESHQRSYHPRGRFAITPDASIWAELLAILNQIIKAGPHRRLCPYGEDCECEFKDLMSQARLLIAKAEGK